MKVVPWDHYFPELEAGAFGGGNVATEEQKEFYYYFKEKLEKGEYVELEDYLAYLFVYLYELVKDYLRKRNIDEFKNGFEKVMKLYSKYEKIEDYYFMWMQGAHYMHKDFDQAWNYLYLLNKSNQELEGRIRFEDILNIRCKCKDTTIDTSLLLNLTGYKKTVQKTLERNYDSFLERMDQYLHKTHVEYGCNIVQFELSKFDFWEMKEEDLRML
jgi:hypothetical protein